MKDERVVDPRSKSLGEIGSIEHTVTSIQDRWFTFSSCDNGTDRDTCQKVGFSMTEN